MRMIAAFLIAFVCAACSAATKPASNETVVAFEVPLSTAKERAMFLAILSKSARAEGAHIDAASDEELRDTAAAMPQAAMSIHAAVWNGTEDKESWAVIMDQADHLGKVWLMFARGRNEAGARRFRERTIGNIRVQWPGTLSLPIINHQTIPLYQDLVKTPQGFQLNSAARSKYSDNPTK